MHERPFEIPLVALREVCDKPRGLPLDKMAEPVHEKRDERDRNQKRADESGENCLTGFANPN